MLIRPAHELGWLIPLLIPGTWYWPKAEKDHILRTDALLQLVGLLPTWCIVDALKCPLWTGASKSKGQPPNIAKPWLLIFVDCWPMSKRDCSDPACFGLMKSCIEASKTAGQLLTVELLNFYHLNAWLVLGQQWGVLHFMYIYICMYCIVLYSNVLYWIAL